ncbi:MAG: NYN domain-containing protein [Pseudomonadota bacterium]
MDRVAVFVDAGYLFAAGSEILLGEKASRGRLKLDVTAVGAFLRQISHDLTGLPLLRVYWYDGTSSGPTLEHKALADTDNIKVRLGIVNQQGEQKGVDSLIVTDMINLARNGAMAAAVLVTGDEDIRVGVQQAEEFGVRVHLVGLRAVGVFNQSSLLIQEADELREISIDELGQFLSVRSPEVKVSVEPDDGTGNVTPAMRVARAVWAAIDPGQREPVKATLQAGEKSIPHEVDRMLLLAMKKELARDLVFDDKQRLRQAFKEVVTADSLGQSRQADHSES